jgi:hypothetical protein
MTNQKPAGATRIQPPSVTEQSYEYICQLEEQRRELMCFARKVCRFARKVCRITSQRPQRTLLDHCSAAYKGFRADKNKNSGIRVRRWYVSSWTNHWRSGRDSRSRSTTNPVVCRPRKYSSTVR